MNVQQKKLLVTFWTPQVVSTVSLDDIVVHKTICTLSILRPFHKMNGFYDRMSVVLLVYEM